MAVIVGIDQFAEVLQESDWYTLGVFLGAKTDQLDFININYRLQGNMRCLIEMYKCLESNGKLPSLTWKTISGCLRRMNSVLIANKIDRCYIRTAQGGDSNESTSQSAPAMPHPQPQSGPFSTSLEVPPSTDPASISHTILVPPEVILEFGKLSDTFTVLHVKAKHAFAHSNTEFSDLQYIIEHRSGLEPLTGSDVTYDKVLGRLQRNFTIFDSHILMVLVNGLVSNSQELQKEISDFQKAVEEFKSSTEMSHLVDLITVQDDGQTQGGLTDDHRKRIKLKLRHFWTKLTMQQFERAMMELLSTLYDFMYQISVSKGCIFITWAIPGIKTVNFVPKHSSEFAKIIGVISLHINDQVIYNAEGRGCETIEAAMLQAIELENTQAVELLLAMGCNPDVALAYKENMGLVNIVNILENGERLRLSRSKHICVFGHDRIVEAMVDRSQREEVDDGLGECELCRIKEKMLRQAHREIESIKKRKKESPVNNDVKADAEIKIKSVPLKKEEGSTEDEQESDTKSNEFNKEMEKELKDQKRLTAILNKKIDELAHLLFKTEQEKKNMESKLIETQQNFEGLKKEYVTLQSDYQETLKANEKLNSKVVELEIALAGEFWPNEEKLKIKNQEIVDLRDVVALKDQKLRELLGDNDAKAKEITSTLEELNHVNEDIEKEVQQKLKKSFCVSLEEIRIVGNIGAGAFYEVCIAEFRRTKVAAKALHSLIKSEYNVGRCVKEAILSAELRHPNIVQFIGAADLDNANPPILLYELMDTSLSDYLWKKQALTHPEIIDAGRDIAAALCYLHQHKPHPIIHRNVSSLKVLMDPLSNGRWKHKLSGFGAASNLEHHDLTIHPGAAAYAAPEAEDPTSHTPSMDVYSYGIMLMELNSNSFPYSHHSEHQKQVDSIEWEPMKKLVLQCIQEDYKDRPAITTVLDNLEAIDN